MQEMSGIHSLSAEKRDRRLQEAKRNAAASRQGKPRRKEGEVAESGDNGIVNLTPDKTVYAARIRARVEQ
jgi:hypothetical protein